METILSTLAPIEKQDQPAGGDDVLGLKAQRPEQNEDVKVEHSRRL
jgi:hypothetical protein